MIPVLLASVPLVGLSSGEAQDDDPWIITENETMEGMRIVLDRELIVSSGATLSLKESNLHVSDGGRILVAPGATLRIDDSEVKRHAQSDYWRFQVYGRLVMNNSVLKGSYGIDLHYAGTIGSRIEHSLFLQNHDYAVSVLRRGEITFSNNTVFDNHQGIQVTDATASIQDNVFLDNPSYAIVLTSTVIGSRMFGPTMGQVQGNIVAHGGGGLDIQEGNADLVTVKENLLTNLTIGMLLHEGDESGGQGNFTKNSIVDNGAAAVNLPRPGDRQVVSELLGYSVDLGDSWLGPEGPVADTDASNYLYGPFDTSRLLDHDPLDHLWEKLQDFDMDP